MKWSCTIYGRVRTKKNSQRILVNKKTGKRFIMQSKSAEGWAALAKPQLMAAWHEPPINAPVQVRATFFRDRAAGDLLNYCQALADVLQAAGVVRDDVLIRSWDGTRLGKDSKNPRVEIEIEVMQ